MSETTESLLREADLVMLMYKLAEGVKLIKVVAGDDAYARGYASGALEVLKVLADEGPSMRVEPTSAE
jgi:hypothetical protein